MTQHTRVTTRYPRALNSIDPDRMAYRPTRGSRQGKDRNKMLINEALARARIRESEHFASTRREAHRLASGRRWRRVERWANRRARRYA
ncbi:hypothetical protein EV191_12124 [Tamaricihabitans halophyticus]|uniref:Uncharacterized protein n=1 Tax=Tamaricihabitans halophyticus TaxID=1262583 RepID=A0A4R2Q4V1_9PSEU|nr:hypothetical protein EV191_12124 [Tamaricihabitans halophyticus]